MMRARGPAHKRLRRLFVLLAGLFLLAACTTPQILEAPARQAAILSDNVFTTRDGLALPMRHWLPASEPTAIVVALHGFNDYGAFFEDAAMYLSRHGIASYAYDQRGFGGSPHWGRWFETESYLTDAFDATRLIAARHPDTPVFLLGNSMGGAVAIATLAANDMPWIKGAVLSAPAVWARQSMPWMQRQFLWLAAHTVPALTVAGRGLNIEPSDNYPMLIALGRDPLIIKDTRIDAIWGLVDLMDLALASTPKFETPALILYGERDEIITSGPTRMMAQQLPGIGQGVQKLAVYKGGYHMLLRDLQAETVWRDIAAWIRNAATPLPSGADILADDFFDLR